MKKSFNFLAIFAAILIFTTLASATTNTFLHYSEYPSQTSYTLENGKSILVSTIAYSHGEEFSAQKLEIVETNFALFKEYSPGIWYDDSEYQYKRNFEIKTSYLDLEPGTYTIRFTAISKSGNSDSSELKLTIKEKPDTTNPIVEIKNPINKKTYEDFPQEGSFIAYDENLEYCEFKINEASYQTISCESSVKQTLTLKNLIEGENTFSVRAYDKSGNVGYDKVTFKVEKQINVDDKNPIVKIISPENNFEYNEKISTAKFTVEEENLQLCWFKLNNLDSELIECDTNIENIINNLKTKEGRNVLTVYARDYSQNIGSDTVEFTIDYGYIDDKNPIVEIIEPIDNKTYNETIDLFKFTVEDDFLYKCWYEFNGVQKTISSCKLSEINTESINSKLGENNLIVYAQDNAGNIGSDEITFFIEKETPGTDLELIIITPEENGKYEERVTFKTKTNLESIVKYSLDEKDYVEMQSADFLTHLSNRLYLEEGWHEVTFCATSGTQEVCKTVDFKIYEEDDDDDDDENEPCCDGNDDKVYGDKELPEKKVNKPIDLGDDEIIILRITFGEKIFWGIVTFLTLLICVTILAYAVERQRQKSRRIKY